MPMFKEDIEETSGEQFRIRTFTADGNEFNFRGETMKAAREKADAFKSGFRQGALLAANAALSAATP